MSKILPIFGLLVAVFVFVSFLSVLPLLGLKKSNSVGVCGPQGCGPKNLELLEKVNMEFSSDEMTQFLNKNKPTNILLSDIKVSFANGKIEALATSFYPFMPGKMSGILSLNTRYFRVEEVSVDGIKMPQKTIDFIEANGNGLWDSLLTEKNIWLNFMEIRGDKLYIDALAPKSE